MTSTIVSNRPNICSLEDWLENPIVGTEWVNDKLVEKHPAVWFAGEPIENDGITLRHSRIQANLAFHWKSYLKESERGGEVYTDAPCCTHQQGRAPDVAYLTPALVAQHGNAKVLPQSFPLIAEVVSPTDFAEDVIAKAQEYLQSGSLEVWLVFPENRWIIVLTENSRQIFVAGEVVSTQAVLVGFLILVDDVLA
jgi:Uma2 family endonuclease